MQPLSLGFCFSLSFLFLSLHRAAAAFEGFSSDERQGREDSNAFDASVARDRSGDV